MENKIENKKDAATVLAKDSTTKEEFEQLLLNNVSHYSKTVAKALKTNFSIESEIGPELIRKDSKISEDKVFVSILYTGVVYGEYILCMDKTVAQKMVLRSELMEGRAIDEDLDIDISEIFSELLNLVVGQCMQVFGSTYQKLTITSPRVFFGRQSYPNLKMSKASLQTLDGEVECLFYIDRMKLDIATSYKTTLEALTVAHNELQLAMAQLQQQQVLLVQSEKMAALGVMAAGVAHEINTPLATIVMLGTGIKDVIKTENQQDEILSMIELIESTVFRISSITNGMKAFAHGVRSEKFVVSSVKALIDETVSMYKQQSESQGVQIICEVPDNIEISCRPAQISQVLVNLLNNSCDAVSELKEKWIKITATNVGENKIEISVTDSGAGIKPDVREKIFDPFFTTKELGRGAGLGLSIARGVIKEHSGHIQLKEDSSNTSILISLPKSQAIPAGSPGA